MKFLTASICILGMIGVVIGVTIRAAETGTISATVTARNSCINRTDSEGTIEYGTVNLNSSTSTEPTTGSNQPTTFDNCGSSAQFNIMTDRFSSGVGTDWTPGGGAASNVFVHSFATTSGLTWQALQVEDTYETASSTVSSGADLTVYLKLDMPTASNDYDQKSTTVTLQAVAQ